MTDLLERSARYLIDNPPTDGLSIDDIRQHVAVRRRRRSAIAGIGCVAVLVAGLGVIANNRANPDNASAPTETLPTVPASDVSPTQESDMAAVQALFDLAPYDRVTDALLVSVREDLKRSCMSEQGFDYTPVPSVVRDVSDALAILPALPTPNQVSELGYAAFADHQTMDTAEAESVQAANDEKAAQDAAFSDALFGGGGSVVGGCTAAALAATEFSGADSAREIYRSLYPAIEVALGQQNSTDPQLLGAVEDWKACLQSAGFTPPPALFPAPDGSTQVAGPAPDEIRMATADLECRTSTMIRDQYVRVHGEAATQFLNDNATRIAELRSAEAAEATEIERIATDLGISQDN